MEFVVGKYSRKYYVYKLVKMKVKYVSWHSNMLDYQNQRLNENTIKCILLNSQEFILLVVKLY